MNPLIHTAAGGERVVALTPGKRVLFLTKDLETIERQLRGELDLAMEDIDPRDLLDDINTDVMTPAWVCFRHRPEDIALDAYAGLVKKDGTRVMKTRALMDGNFEVIVSGQRKGTGSSRETAPQCESWSGIRLVVAASFAPIHERNNINLGPVDGRLRPARTPAARRAARARGVHRQVRPGHARDPRVRRPVPLRHAPEAEGDRDPAARPPPGAR